MPYGSYLDRPLWLEKVAADWVQRRSPASALFAAVVSILLVGGLDAGVAVLVGYDFAVTVLYLVPIGFAAWAVGITAGVACAGLAGAVEAAVTWSVAHGAMSPWILAASVGLELLVFLGAAFTFARLRWYLERHRQLSRTDPLTGIGNHRTFDEALRREAARIGRRPSPVSIVYLDLDHFKQLNDTRGHVAGNELLRLVGETLQAAVRAVDTAARVGGDEFAVLLADTGPAACRAMVERLRERLGRSLRAAGFSTTFSVGAVTFEGSSLVVDDLLVAVDRAMYEVKNGGRNGVRFDVLPSSAAAAEAEARAAPPLDEPEPA